MSCFVVITFEKKFTFDIHLCTLICLLSFVYSSQNRYAVWSDQCVNFYGTFCKICWYSSNCHSLVCTKSYLWYSWFAIKMWRVCKNKELTTEKIKNKKKRISFFFFFFCDGYYISSFGLLCTRDDECIETLKPKSTYINDIPSTWMCVHIRLYFLYYMYFKSETCTILYVM